jgi:hypothetical protein
MGAGAEQEAVLRALRGEAVELVARTLEVTAADVSNWTPAKTPFMQNYNFIFQWVR